MGREEMGREELTATGMYREKEMTFWLERAERALEEARHASIWLHIGCTGEI